MEGSQARFILLVQTLLPLSHNDIGDINKIINYLITPPSVSLTILFRLPTSPDQVPRWSLEKFKTNSCTGAPLWVEVHNPSRLLFSKPSSLLWVEIYIRSNKWTILSVRDPSLPRPNHTPGVIWSIFTANPWTEIKPSCCRIFITLRLFSYRNYPITSLDWTTLTQSHCITDQCIEMKFRWNQNSNHF